MERKGLSPVISAVLLLAVTLSVAAIFSSWGPTVIKSVTGDTKNQTDKTIDCNRAGVEIQSTKYFDAENISVVLRNSGNMDLDEVQVFAWENDLLVNDTLISIDQGNFTTVNISADSKPDKVEAYSKYCTSVTDTEDDIKS